MTDAVQLAKGVLAAEGEPFATLSLAANLPPVTADTSVADARRSYMRLAGAIHPDRLQGSFDKATEAFQCLVRAFECFADPKLRKKAAAEAAKKAKAAAAAPPAKKAEAATPAQRTSKKDAKVKKEKAAKAPKKQPKRAGKKAVEEESDAEESEPTESDAESDANSDDNDWETWAAADVEPEVSTSRTPIGQPRVGGLYHQTTVGCPKCRTSWEPDARPQYSLFMGQWGRRVHCQLCLFDFGSATAMHACPHCHTGFDYDASMYDEVQKCAKCKKQFGFAYYPVNQHLIDQIALEEWRARKERAKAAEREARARARHGGGGAGATPDSTDKAAAETDEETQLLIGSCVVNEECPLCHQRVKNHHRSHVLECAAKAPAERAAAGKSKKAAGQQSQAATAAAGKKEVAKKPAAKPAAKRASKAAPKVAGKKASKATAASRKRRRGGSSSDEDEDDEDDSEASLSDSEEEDMSSESSFSDDDDDESD